MFDSQDAFQMGSCDAAVCCYSQSDSICYSRGANLWFLQLAKPSHTVTEPSLFMHSIWLHLFHQLFTAHRPTYLTQRFQTLFRQFKRLYFTTLLSILYVPWPTGAFCHCFASSTVVSWQQFCYIGQLHSILLTMDVDIFFFTTLVQLWSDVWSSQLSVTQTGDSDEIVPCSCWF